MSKNENSGIVFLNSLSTDEKNALAQSLSEEAAGQIRPLEDVIKALKAGTIKD